MVRPALWLTLLAALLLGGCGEVLNEYYLSNHTDAALTVRLTPHYPELVDLAAGPLIEDVQTGVRGSLPQPVSFEQQGDTLQFAVPPKTTIFLGISSGGNDLFSQLEVETDGRRIALDDSNTKDYFAVHDNFIGPVVHVFNVE